MKVSRRVSWVPWVMLVVAAAFAVAWAVSLRSTIFVMDQFGKAAGIKACDFFCVWVVPAERERLAAATGLPLESNWSLYRSPRRVPLNWDVPRVHSTGTRGQFVFPLWLPPVPLVVLGIWSRRVIRRRAWVASGCCGACGYSRAGIAAEVACPECGKKAPLARGR